MSDRFHRQLGLVDMNKLQNMDIHVCGVGGIGSATTLFLAKMGAKKITVYDHDTLEEHNISNQTYPYREIGSPKVEAMKRMIAYMEGVEITARNRKMTGKEDFDGGILIVGVDSMAARKEIYDNLLLNFSRPSVLIDARMGGHALSIYHVNVMNTAELDKYGKTLYSDEHAVQEACTERSIIYNTAKIGAMICNAVKRTANGEEHPFSYHYDFRHMEGMIV